MKNRSFCGLRENFVKICMKSCHLKRFFGANLSIQVVFSETLPIGIETTVRTMWSWSTQKLFDWPASLEKVEASLSTFAEASLESESLANRPKCPCGPNSHRRQDYSAPRGPNRSPRHPKEVEASDQCQDYNGTPCGPTWSLQQVNPRHPLKGWSFALMFWWHSGSNLQHFSADFWHIFRPIFGTFLGRFLQHFSAILCNEFSRPNLSRPNFSRPNFSRPNFATISWPNLMKFCVNCHIFKNFGNKEF